MGWRIDYPQIGISLMLDDSGDLRRIQYKWPNDVNDVKLRDVPYWLELAGESLAAATELAEALEQDVRDLERKRSDLEAEIDDLREQLAARGES